MLEHSAPPPALGTLPAGTALLRDSTSHWTAYPISFKMNLTGIKPRGGQGGVHFWKSRREFVFLASPVSRAGLIPWPPSAFKASKGWWRLSHVASL